MGKGGLENKGAGSEAPRASARGILAKASESSSREKGCRR